MSRASPTRYIRTIVPGDDLNLDLFPPIDADNKVKLSSILKASKRKTFIGFRRRSPELMHEKDEAEMPSGFQKMRNKTAQKSRNNIKRMTTFKPVNRYGIL